MENYANNPNAAGMSGMQRTYHMDATGATPEKVKAIVNEIYEHQKDGVEFHHSMVELYEFLHLKGFKMWQEHQVREEMEKLKEICSNQGKEISIVNGQTKDLKAYENEENSVTLIQYQAGAMGLNLQKANKIIYFSLPERSELFEQSKKRIHRIGQDRPCFYYYLISNNTIEVDILETLKMRKDYTDELFKLKEGE